ncbi:CHRD domain-containing protein [Rhodococcoides kyotonense]|uniref:CHRD domain-containing protein n=1 Tax=Rhodococcoides kyotonense TaxID=398843 RepID=A0A239MKC4_9NOCA|nr:CHRD domain-containing protein [Rhodococcus kyotonensis]SNT43427.1 CHRD domain-containing protein [Rhodococcus kyotonensis]
MTTARSIALAGGAVAAASIMVLGAAPASAETPVEPPATFTSAFTAMATPDQVLNGDGAPTPGQSGATGSFTFRINSDLDIICYDIELDGVTGDYMSPAKTATHIHQAASGEAGPPRLAFENPTPIGDGPRTSSGCIQGPFTTGLAPDGTDTGTGFSLTEIEANPAGFAADTHTVDFSAGAVRGQLTPIPVGGVATGGGGSAISTAPVVAGASVFGVAALLGAAVVVRRRNGASS